MKGKQVYFLTNSSGRTRDEYADKIKKLGFGQCTRDMVYGSAYTTARYVKENYPEIKKVHVVGMKSIAIELAEQGIPSCGGEDDLVGGRMMSLDEFEAF